MKIFVSVTEFCRHNNSHVFNLICFCATRCGDKIQLTRSDLPLRSVSATYCLVSSGLYSKGDLLFKSAPVSTHFCYQLLASLDVILAVQEAPATVTTVLLSAGSNYGNCLSCGLAKTSGATFSTNEK